MRNIEIIRSAVRGLQASHFSVISNVIATTTGLMFFGGLLALTTGVGQFLEQYYTRTMSLTTLLAYQDVDAVEATPFDASYRQKLSNLPGVSHVFYHDLGFADIEMSQGRSVTVALRTATGSDPEIERLEKIAGSNLPEEPNPLQPALVISLDRAQRLSDLPPDELVGREVAINLDRSLSFEGESDYATLYGRIAGVVNETPDNCVYVNYRVLALIDAWRQTGSVVDSKDQTNETADTTEVEKEMPPTAVAPATPVVEELTAASEDTPPIERPGGESTAPAVSTKVEPAALPTDGFLYARLPDAWKAIEHEMETGDITYPHLRLHLDSLDAVVRMREFFRDQGLPTATVLDDVAAIRELRNYASFIGAAVGLITLVAAICSIFNTVLASVERRTQEIGLLRSLGASTGSVSMIFVLEAIIVAIAGALAACSLFWIGLEHINRWIVSHLQADDDFAQLAELQPELFVFPSWLAALLVGLAITAAVVASLIPAIRACRIQPAEALRHS